VNIGTKPVRRRAIYLGTAVVTGLLLGFSCAAKTADFNPLHPADTSGPRATLQGFVETMDNIYIHMAEVLKSYAASGRHYSVQRSAGTSWRSLRTDLRPLELWTLPGFYLFSTGALSAVSKLF
jgi:hypothetical protein